jgi:1,4-dihydroxy-6-naphthoate synthase
MFDALIHHKVDTEGLEFEVHYEDIETLNLSALEGQPDITKLSTKALSLVLESYSILNSGAALGFGVGPLLLSRSEIPDWEQKMETFRIGIPGQLTTANFLLDFAFPVKKHKTELVFSEIEDSILQSKIDIGLVIHESRFTYRKKGLHKLLDLGTYWEEKTGLPIPLAAIAVKKSLPPNIKLKVDRVLKRSIEFAFAYPESSMDFVRSLSQDMDEDVVKKHIGLYVNSFSLDLGALGKSALVKLFNSFNPELNREDVFLMQS